MNEILKKLFNAYIIERKYDMINIFILTYNLFMQFVLYLHYKQLLFNINNLRNTF